MSTGSLIQVETALPVPQCWAVTGSEAGCHQITWELPEPLPAPGPSVPPLLLAQVNPVLGYQGAGWVLCVTLQTKVWAWQR